MKKILALGLASAMAMSMAAVASAKKDIRFPIESIGTKAYQYDEDYSVIDLSQPVDRVAYGETFYYPLISSTSVSGSNEEIAAAQALYDEKEAAYIQVKSSYDEAVENAADKSATLRAAKSHAEEGDFILTNARAESAAADRLVLSRREALISAEAARIKAAEALDRLNTANFRYVYESDAVNGVKVRTKWDDGGEYVNSVGVEKKKVAGAAAGQKYLYFVAVSLNDSDTMDANHLTGAISLRKSGSFDYDEMELSVNIELSYPTAGEAVITEEPQIFEEGKGFVESSDAEFLFAVDRDSYFTVNTIGQSKLLLAMSNDHDEKIADLHPEANLSFFYGNGAAFNKAGTLSLAADEGSFLYMVNKWGNLERLHAEYDESEEAFKIRTKVLGKYVVSDTRLKLF